MPTYAYLCPNCRDSFEAVGRTDDRFQECPRCGSSAERRPFSGIPYIKGETVARSIPDPSYAQEKGKKELKAQGWTAERSIDLIRKNLVTDDKGEKSLDLKAMKEGNHV